MRDGPAADKVTIRIEPDGLHFDGQVGDQLLTRLRELYYGRSGRPAFPGCRNGGCGYCKVELLEGEVMHGDAYSRGALPDEERLKGRILMCQAHLLGDVVIRLLPKDDPLARLLQKLKAQTHNQGRFNSDG